MFAPSSLIFIDHLAENFQQYSISCLCLAIALEIVRSRPPILNVAMVKQFANILVDKGITIIADNLMGNAKSTNYVFTNEIWTGVEDKFFTLHGFISLVTHTMSTLLWILGKPLLKPKRAHIYTKRHQSSWFKLIVHHLIFWLIIQAHESHWGNFKRRGLEGQEVCSVKL